MVICYLIEVQSCVPEVTFIRNVSVLAIGAFSGNLQIYVGAGFRRLSNNC